MITAKKELIDVPISDLTPYERNPQYCQAIIDRWEKLTGQKAEKVDA